MPEKIATVVNDVLNVLIVEDDEDTRRNLCDILELDGHTVTAVASLSEAMAFRGWESLDVVLLDRKLSDGHAEDLLPELRRLAPDADVIVITGHTDLDGTITALRYGVSDYVIKPVNPDVLRAGLDRTAKRRRTERRLREEREFAEKILQTAEAIVLILDLSGRIIRVNPYLELLTGYERRDLIGEDWFRKLIPPGDYDKARLCLDVTDRHRELRGIVQPILTRDGRLCQVRWSNTTLKDERGEVHAMLCIGLDITDFVQTQQQLLQAERLAAIGETVAGLAHESRNALQRIRSGIEVLELTIGDHPDVLKDLRRIDKAAEDLRALLDEVRSFAAPIVLERQPIDIGRTWKYSWDQLRQATSPDRIMSLEEHLLGDFEPVYADRRKLESVFRNLFQNSMECCQGPVRIEVHAEQNQQGTRIEIVDHGPGLTVEQANQVFRAFYTTKATGTGLGLAICRRVVEAHGGTIHVDTGRSGGACFVMWLPRPETTTENSYRDGAVAG